MSSFLARIEHITRTLHTLIETHGAAISTPLHAWLSTQEPELYHHTKYGRMPCYAVQYALSEEALHKAQIEYTTLASALRTTLHLPHTKLHVRTGSDPQQRASADAMIYFTNKAHMQRYLQQAYRVEKQSQKSIVVRRND